jgi:hypothetical protein
MYAANDGKEEAAQRLHVHGCREARDDEEEISIAAARAAVRSMAGAT